MLEARKIESKIKQCKLLGIKTTITYDVVNHGRSKSKSKNHGQAGPKVQLEIPSIVEKATTVVIAQHLVKNALNAAKKNHFKSVCKAGGSNNDKHDHSRSRSKKKKGKKFHEVNKTENTEMDDLQEQVQSLFYHDVHFNNVNIRMHTKLQCETKSRNKSKQVFKIDTGVDGNLMPITMFSKLPKDELRCSA